MAPTTLTQPQREILEALTVRYSATEQPVPRETLAGVIDDTPELIDRELPDMKARQLVESRPGPKGGYIPTATTYDVLARQEIEQPAPSPLIHDGQRVEPVPVRAIEFPAIHDPTRCQALIRFHRALPAVECGERLSIGPTPGSHLRVTGTIVETRPASATLVLTIDALHAPGENHETQDK